MFTREHTITIEGKTYTFVLNNAALVALEGLYRTPTRELTWMQILDRAQANGGSFTYMTGVVWAALRTHHAELAPRVWLRPGEILDFDASTARVNALVDRVGWPEIGRLFDRLNEHVTPDPADREDLEAGNPTPAPAAAPGSGGAST